MIEVNCGSPGLLYNGWTEGSKTTLGAVVEFRCHDNMLYEGNQDRRAMCLQNGTWSHPLPRCFGRWRRAGGGRGRMRGLGETEGKLWLLSFVTVAVIFVIFLSFFFPPACCLPVCLPLVPFPHAQTFTVGFGRPACITTDGDV